MSEDSTQITSPGWRPTDFSALAAAAAGQRPPRKPGTLKLLTRLPIVALCFAYVIDFLVVQLPELGGVTALATISYQADVLVWSSLPGTGGAGAHGTYVLMIIGAIALPVIARWPTARIAAVPAAMTVLAGVAIRIEQVLGGHWSPLPTGGLLLAALIAAVAIFAAREIMLTDVAAGTPGYRRPVDWRGTGWFLLFAIAWLPDVAIGRYFDHPLVAAVRRQAEPVRWRYLDDKSSWWMYGLGVLVVAIGFGVAQLLPPWDSRAKQLVIGAIVIIAALVAFQQLHASATHAVEMVVRFGPSPSREALTGAGRSWLVLPTGWPGLGVPDGASGRALTRLR